MKRALTAIALVFLSAGLAAAHCDSLDGPVVAAAKASLQSGDPAPALAWVRPGDEAAVKEAFNKTVEVRKAGGKAAELADLWFFETLVRLHRAGEGAPYTGLKPAGSAEEIVKEVDSAIMRGEIKELAGKIGRHSELAITKRFAALPPLRKEAGQSVEKGREYVEAYVTFIHYVENVAKTVHSEERHGGEEEAATPAHRH
ncbi:MAG: hypothetical protein HY952_00800 [Elusimicrobia bacterium]|nr:hypothetical protein [Elusimicrobiota bacterium]